MNEPDRRFVRMVAELEAAIQRGELGWFDRLRLERQVRDAARAAGPFTVEELRDLVDLGRDIGSWRAECAA